MTAMQNHLRGVIVAVSRSGIHSFAKANCERIRLVPGFGVEGDAHAGSTVRHRSRVAKGAAYPNLRQVHLIHAELHDELAAAGFTVGPGEMGENLTTRGVPLLALPVGTRLRIGQIVLLELTGLRNPCVQIDRFRSGLLAEVGGRDAAGAIVRRAGVMSVVLAGGEVRPGDPILVELPEEPHRGLDVV